MRGGVVLAASDCANVPCRVVCASPVLVGVEQDATTADAELASSLALWIKNVTTPPPHPSARTPPPATLAVLTTWLSGLVASYEPITLKALLQHNGGAEVMVALLHRGEDECARQGASTGDVAAW